jgi:hypothetical protein
MYDCSVDHDEESRGRAPEKMEMVYLLALASSPRQDSRLSFFEKLVGSLVRIFQPDPVMAHVELFLPTHERRGEMHFSTYYGKHAGWGSDFKNSESFYTGENGSRWRAIPVMGRGILSKLRRECASEADVATEYSLVGYVFSVPPLRALSSVRDNSVGAPAHCAALAARVLTRAIPSIDLPCSDAWYGPSTLFIELSKQSRMQLYDEYITDTTPATLSLPEQQELSNAKETLLSGTDAAVRTLTTDACMSAIRRQSHLVISAKAAGDVSPRTSVLEQGLARMLLRWSTLQNAIPLKST